MSKVKRCLEVFYEQPSNVIQWTPGKEYYSWGLVGPARAQRMLAEILRILTSNEEKDTE